jgi:hypothetical protein
MRKTKTHSSAQRFELAILYFHIYELQSEGHFHDGKAGYRIIMCVIRMLGMCESNFRYVTSLEFSKVEAKMSLLSCGGKYRING